VIRRQQRPKFPAGTEVDREEAAGATPRPRRSSLRSGLHHGFRDTTMSSCKLFGHRRHCSVVTIGYNSYVLCTRVIVM
jgi:hypothetical protein